jgi:hypothetical protein
MGKRQLGATVDQQLFTFKLTPDGVNAVLNLLGKSPIESGLAPLWDDLRTQVQAQVEEKSKQQEADKQPE